MRIESFHLQQRAGRFLTAFLVFFLALPFAFVGLDFTDHGYHYYNQYFYGIFDGAIRNTCYFWLSDFISGSLIHLFGGSFYAIKLNGILIWSLLGFMACTIFMREFKSFLQNKSDYFLWVLFLVGSLLLSGSSMGQGSTLVADYYVVPTVFVLGIYAVTVNGLRDGFSSKRLAGLFILLSLLPLLRWPLVVTSFFVLGSLFALGRLNRQKKIAVGVFAMFYLLACYFYQSLFLTPTLGMSRANSNAIGNIIRANLTDLKAFLLLSAWGALIYFAFLILRVLKRSNGFKFYTIAIVSFFILLLTSFALTEMSVYVFRGGIWFFSAHCIYFFCVLFVLYVLFARRDLAEPRQRVLVIFSLLLAAMYGVGSDNGFMKSGFFSFIPLIFAFRFLIPIVSKKFYLKVFCLFIFCLGLIQFHRALYRDELSLIYQQPVAISDSVLGLQISHPRTYEIISDLKSLLKQHPELIEGSAVIPMAPLLNSYLKNVDKTLIFLSIKHSSQRLDWIREAYQRGTIRHLIEAKVTLADPIREFPQSSLSEACINKEYSSVFFRVIDVQCLLK